MKYRFNWNAPIILSKHEPGTLYHASQHLLRSRDEGQTWEEVSPDLSRNDKTKQGYSGGPIQHEITGVENYGTIFYVVESPHEKDTLWVGTDDGLVHITRNNGATWENVTPKGIPEWSRTNAIDVSPHDKSTAYVAATMYQFDDYRPYLYKTSDYGRTWTKIVNGIPDRAFTRVVREDPGRRGLLFAGTESGLFISFDDGANWAPLQRNLPVVPVTDMIIKREDLVLATQGRSFWVLKISRRCASGSRRSPRWPCTCSSRVSRTGWPGIFVGFSKHPFQGAAYSHAEPCGFGLLGFHVI